MNLMEKVGESVKNRAKRTVLDPINQMVDTNLTDITTTIGSFVIRSIRGKFQRSITITVGLYYNDKWLEDALYAVLYESNNLKKASQLRLVNKGNIDDGTGVYCQLDDGTHNLKFRQWDILLAIQTVGQPSPSGRIMQQKVYTIITYDLSVDFVRAFEQDMIRNRNALLAIKHDSPTISVFRDGHESDGQTYWDKLGNIQKRRIGTIYLPHDQKKLLVDTINEFVASKKYYNQHGIPHNLKILLYGEPGTGKSSIVKMIASEWNRNLMECTGGKDGKFMPNAIVDNFPELSSPLYSISDIDKYPFLINEPDIDLSKEGAKEEEIRYRQIYGSMINALDGVMSGEDKIIVMTTNHIEKFSDVFLRPGRVDLQMHIGYVVPEVFRKYIWDFYQEELPEDIKLKSNKITIADLQRDVVFLKLTVDEIKQKYLK